MVLTDAGSGADTLSRLLNELDAVLNSHGAHALAEQLAPPAPQDEVLQVLASLGIAAHPELVTWFGWHNGYSKLPGNLELATGLPTFGPLSLDEIVGLYQSQDHGSEPWQWPTNRLPLMASGGAEILAVEVHGPDSLTVFPHDPFDADYRPDGSRHSSLCTPVAWWTHAIRSGAYRYRPETWSWDKDRREERLEEWLLRTSLV